MSLVIGVSSGKGKNDWLVKGMVSVSVLGNGGALCRASNNMS